MFNKTKLQQGATVAKERTMGFWSFPLCLWMLLWIAEEILCQANTWKNEESTVKLLDCVSVWELFDKVSLFSRAK